jgi:hypothetical protein
VDDLDTLRHEFLAKDAFFMQLACHGCWDKAAFNRLELAMRRACAAVAGRDDLPRWMVEGFWQCVEQVPGWARASNACPTSEYLETAIERFHDLQYWLVMGESIYLPEHEWKTLS